VSSEKEKKFNLKAGLVAHTWLGFMKAINLLIILDIVST